MLNKEEKDYLFSKLEINRKKKSVEKQDDIYQMLKGDKKIDEEGFIKILNSLDYSFKKKLKEGEMNSTLFKAIKEKLPESWLGVKYSSLAAHKKKIEKSKNENIITSFDNFNKLNS